MVPGRAPPFKPAPETLGLRHLQKGWEGGGRSVAARQAPPGLCAMENTRCGYEPYPHRGSRGLGSQPVGY